jgi:lantibiotic modifying enzyme
LFFAALYSVTREPKYRELSLGCLEPMLRYLRSTALESLSTFPRTIGLGVASGLGSIIYTCTTISRLLDASELMPSAVRLADLVTPDLIESARKYDLFDGLSGLCVALCVLLEHTSEPAIKDKLQLCGDKLIREHTSNVAHRDSGKALDEGSVTGFARGHAGVGYALIRLYEACAEPAFLAAADGLINCESTATFAHNNPTWCDGSSGLGVAQLHLLNHLDRPSVATELARTIAHVCASTAPEYDHLCCGALGRSEFLLFAGLSPGRNDLINTARSRVGSVLQRHEKTDRFALPGNGDVIVDRYFPGFFQGVAGIGYSLLRACEPEKLPCVLAYQ